MAMVMDTRGAPVAVDAVGIAPRAVPRERAEPAQLLRGSPGPSGSVVTGPPMHAQQWAPWDSIPQPTDYRALAGCRRESGGVDFGGGRTQRGVWRWLESGGGEWGWLQNGCQFPGRCGPHPQGLEHSLSLVPPAGMT